MDYGLTFWNLRKSNIRYASGVSLTVLYFFLYYLCFRIQSCTLLIIFIFDYILLKIIKMLILQNYTLKLNITKCHLKIYLDIDLDGWKVFSGKVDDRFQNLTTLNFRF